MGENGLERKRPMFYLTHCYPTPYGNDTVWLGTHRNGRSLRSLGYRALRREGEEREKKTGAVWVPPPPSGGRGIGGGGGLSVLAPAPRAPLSRESRGIPVNPS